MKIRFLKTLYCSLILCSFIAQAKENVTQNTTSSNNPNQTLANNCAVGTAQTELDINNVKTTIMNGGDMWWDLSNGRYEIPQGSGKHSLFAGALWIGGYDDNGQLKVAGQTYRQSGTDYWPGPLDNVRLTSEGMNNPSFGSTEASICAQFDKHYLINKNEVLEFVEWSNSENPEIEFPNYQIPENILEYPGNRTTDDLSNSYIGSDNQVGTSPFYALETLAPFEDVNNDGFYNPFDGDYPKYNADGSVGCIEEDLLFGDQTMWWVFNDNGNIHTETGSETALGLEIQAQAFAFAPSGIEALDNSTFYNYKIINRSHTPLNDTYFGVWVDPDIGDYQDDYVGCDVARGLGYCYNGDEDDGTAVGYGANPPAIGVDFFRGPLADANDGVDNNGDGVVDEPGEQIIMSKFVYYNNIQGTVDGNPNIAQDFYNYLDGKWLDNSLMTYGGDGQDQNNPACDYMFPGDTDPAFPGQTWTEQTAGNVPDDRRFLQSAGKFTLAPGALNTITTGVVWARANEGGAFASVEKLRVDDDYIQNLFDICFDVPCGEPNGSLASYAINEDNYGLDMQYGIQFEYPISEHQVTWDFGDGYSSSSLLPVHYYNNTGNYSVTITVTSDCSELENIDTHVFDIHVPYYLNQQSIVGVPITRLEGIGNSSNHLELSNESLEYIRDNYSQDMIEYKRNYGPFSIHIPDTSSVSMGDYQVKVVDPSQNFTWEITQLATGEIMQFTNYEDINEVYTLEDWGFEIQINNAMNPGDEGTNSTSSNGFLSATEIRDNSTTWLNYIKDNDDWFDLTAWNPEVGIFVDPRNWIRSGNDAIDHLSLDNGESYETILSGTWAPYRLVGVDGQGTGAFEHSPAWNQYISLSNLRDIPSVDIVFTDNQNLWTRCPVIETGSGTDRLNLKSNPSVGKDGQFDSSGTTGFSWFPGYAIDIDKGIRLNIMFGESSDHPDHNGNDMIWNPTSTEILETGSWQDGDYSQDIVFGGRHYVYVMKTQYAGSDATAHSEYDHLTSMNSLANKRNVFRETAWVSIPMLSSTNEEVSDGDVEVKIRVSKTFDAYFTDGQNNGLPIYLFSISNDYSDLEIEQVNSNTSKILVKTINILGQDVSVNYLNTGTPYIEIYDDGSVIKRIKTD